MRGVERRDEEANRKGKSREKESFFGCFPFPKNK